MSAIDVLILLPILPLAPLLLVWYLPWENWVWERLPPLLRKFTGPYLLYASFVAWHFKLAWWTTLAVFATGVGLSVWAVLKDSNAGKKK
jgi:hypothetical protein